MKRIYIYILAGTGIVILAVVLALILAASRKQAPSKRSAQNERTTLTIWRPLDDGEVFDSLIARYEEKNPQIKIEYVKKKLDNYELDSINAQLAGKGPDIWSIPNYWLERHKEKLAPLPAGFLAPKNSKVKNPDINVEEIKKSFVPVVADEIIMDNKVYGYPLFVDTLALIGHQDLFKEVYYSLPSDRKETKDLLRNGPKNWQEFITLAKLLTKKANGKIVQAGAALGTSNNVTNSADLLAALMLQNNTQMNSEDKQLATFNLPQTKSSGSLFNPGQNALEFYTRFSDPHSDAYVWSKDMPPDFEAFADKKVAMIFAYLSQVKKLVEKNPDLPYGIAPLPQIRGQKTPVDMASYWVETVPASSKHQIEAWKFLTYLMSQGLNNYLKKTDRPTPLIIKNYPSVSERYKKDNPWNFQQQTAKSWYRGSEPQKVYDYFNEMIKAVNDGQSSLNALNLAASKITATFREQ